MGVLTVLALNVLKTNMENKMGVFPGVAGLKKNGFFKGSGHRPTECIQRRSVLCWVGSWVGRGGGGLRHGFGPGGSFGGIWAAGRGCGLAAAGDFLRGIGVFPG